MAGVVGVVVVRVVGYWCTLKPVDNNSIVGSNNNSYL